MALLAEELIEEWLRRQGFFTIRGARVGVHEIDLLAVKPTVDGVVLRHVEVQASVRPIGYISSLPVKVQKQLGKHARSVVQRDDEMLRQGVHEWITKKFDHPGKQELRTHLWTGSWTRELVVHKVREPLELEHLEAFGVQVHRLAEIVRQLQADDATVQKRIGLQRAAGSDFVDLLSLHPVS
jgi:Holliday junction resolvase-like predicted endonuclease